MIQKLKQSLAGASVTNKFKLILIGVLLPLQIMRDMISVLSSPATVTSPISAMSWGISLRILRASPAKFALLLGTSLPQQEGAQGIINTLSTKNDEPHIQVMQQATI